MPVEKLGQRRPDLVIISGPSGVGKGPLTEAFRKHFQGSPVESSIQVYKGRAPRSNDPNELTYCVGSSKKIMRMYQKSPGDYLLWDCRGTKQLLNLTDTNLRHKESEKSTALADALNTLGNKQMLLEIYHTALSSPENRQKFNKFVEGRRVRTVFISPLEKKVIAAVHSAGHSFRDFIAGYMSAKVLGRSTRDETDGTSKSISRKEKRDALRRARDAYDELSNAHQFDLILPAYSSEDVHPIARVKREKRLSGELKRAFDRLDEIFRTGTYRGAKKEKWKAGFIK